MARPPLNVKLQQLAAEVPTAPSTSTPLGNSLAFNQISVELAADEVFWMAADSSIVYVNESACRKLEYTRDELVGMRVWEWDPLFPREVWPTFWAEIHEARSVVFETRHRSKSGHEFPVRIKAHYVEHEGTPYLLAFVTDITEQVEAKAELERKVHERTEELERFVYRTSHDLKAPLVTAGHLAGLIIDEVEEGNLEQAKASAARVAKLTNNLSRLVSDMLDLVKTDLQPHVASSFDVRALVEEASEHVLETHGHPCVVTRSFEGPREVLLQRGRVLQVVQNLLSNAVKYRDPRRSECRAHVAIAIEPNVVRIRVEDNGLGIPDQHRGQIFDRFSRFHTTAAQGSGLGLAIVAQHVEKMGGTIEVSSSPAGTTFDVRIPA